ncbi:MAG: hypothetical protein EOM91_16395 [Sphingobacteriia bacterium]|nr:hypothetical protein [Sphingobacteriia bacterium]NCC40739.1 hypothetical protein [Gammaproteobacteria bacterium]
MDTADADIPANLFLVVTQSTKTLAAGDDCLLADIPFRSGLTKSVDKAFATSGETLELSLKPRHAPVPHQKLSHGMIRLPRGCVQGESTVVSMNLSDSLP